MSHNSVVALMRDSATTLADTVQFGYGRQSDFNQITNKTYPYIWLAPLNAVPAFAQGTYMYQKAWSCAILFFQLDKADSIETQYKPILDEMDGYVDRFINTLNETLNTVDGDPIIQGINQTPIFKESTDTATGWLLTFTLLVPDDFDYCSIYPTPVNNGDDCGDTE